MSDTVYLGNPNLKKANVKVEFTQENIEEFIKCKDDPVYFAKNYIKIVSLDEGLVNFNLYPFQEKLIKNFHNESFHMQVAVYLKDHEQLMPCLQVLLYLHYH